MRKAEMPKRYKKKILAISSAGGHWIQLMRLLSALEGHNIVFVTTKSEYKTGVDVHTFYTINDATRWNKFGLVIQAIRVCYIVLREKPNVVISTGASCGFFALFFGKLIGTKTIWVDSIANAAEMSLSGKLVGWYADLWLTQWPNVARLDGPQYKGSTL